jgi:Cu/Ag efflux pump CusA
MKRIAAPMVGGVVTSVLMELAVYPVIYYWWKGALRWGGTQSRRESRGERG